MKNFSKFILRLWGWKITGGLPEGVKKAVIVAAPHTSNMDYIIGRLAFFVLNVNVRFLIKKEAFFWPVGGLVKKWGGIPVDRGRRSNLVSQVAEQFNKHDSLYIVITPEGTRKRVNHWKKGFYYVAQKANVPVALCYIDYKTKEGGVGPLVDLSGNYAEDLKKFREFYQGKHARHPEKFNPDAISPR